MSPPIPYPPGQRTYPNLPPALERQLSLIAPSHAGRIVYRPCAVELIDGSSHERTYVQDAQSYMAEWGVWPEDDPGKWSVDISQVAAIRESSDRLPPELARRIYEGGESGMGYTVFTLVFRDGKTKAFVAGNAVDFVTYPTGYSAKDVESVVLHSSREDHPAADSAPYRWCLYGSSLDGLKQPRD